MPKVKGMTALSMVMSVSSSATVTGKTKDCCWPGAAEAAWAALAVAFVAAGLNLT
jgi:hypothetical protein